MLIEQQVKKKQQRKSINIVRLRVCGTRWAQVNVPCLPSEQVDVSDVTKTTEAFLKIASVYKEENTEVKAAVLDSIGEMQSNH